MLKENNIVRREARKIEVVEGSTLDDTSFRLQKMIEKMNEDFAKQIRPYLKPRKFRQKKNKFR